MSVNSHGSRLLEGPLPASTGCLGCQYKDDDVDLRERSETSLGTMADNRVIHFQPTTDTLKTSNCKSRVNTGISFTKELERESEQRKDNNKREGRGEKNEQRKKERTNVTLKRNMHSKLNIYRH